MARFALPAVLLGALILSSSAIFVRLSEVGPIATGAYRMLLPLPVFWVWMMLEKRDGQYTHARGWPTDPRDVWIIMLSGVFYAADLAAWHISIGMTTVANATVLANTAPVVVALAAFVLFRERVTRVFLAGLALAPAGAAILMRASFAVSAETGPWRCPLSPHRHVLRRIHPHRCARTPPHLNRRGARHRRLDRRRNPGH